MRQATIQWRSISSDVVYLTGLVNNCHLWLGDDEQVHCDPDYDFRFEDFKRSAWDKFAC
jgi:hypothetical protein